MAGSWLGLCKTGLVVVGGVHSVGIEAYQAGVKEAESSFQCIKCCCQCHEHWWGSSQPQITGKFVKEKCLWGEEQQVPLLRCPELRLIVPAAAPAPCLASWWFLQGQKLEALGR